MKYQNPTCGRCGFKVVGVMEAIGSSAYERALLGHTCKPMITVREFSPAGPCLELGEFLRRTPRFIVYRDRHGTEKRIGGWKISRNNGAGRAYVHTEPCVSCRDHEETQYPHGYMD